MTHDELRHRLGRDIWRNDYRISQGEDVDNSPLNALRAVVELHKPEYWENIYDPSWNGNECSVCFTDGNLETPSVRIDYPCPTIQAIEKELG